MVAFYKWKSKRYANTIGAWFVTVKTDDKGNFDKLTATSSPYYISNKKDYEGTKIKSSLNNRPVTDLDSASIESSLKLLRYVKNDMPVDTYMKKFHINFKELEGLLYIWEMCGKKVEIVQRDGELFLEKTSVKKSTFNKIKLDKLKENELLVVSDTHFGSIHNQLHLLNALLISLLFYRFVSIGKT